MASVAMMLGPPAFVTIAILLPFNSGKYENAFMRLKSSWDVFARRTPACLRATSIILSEPVREPV